MTLVGQYTATVDRIEDDVAVLLVEGDGEVVDERHLPVGALPEDAGEGAVCQLTFDADDLVDVTHLAEETATRRERLREKFDRLSRRLDDE